MLRKLNPWSTDGGMAPSVPSDTVENVGEVLRLRKPSTKFGRSRSENDFYLDSPKFQKLISRRHAEIHRSEEKGKCVYTIQDSSLNGTFINDYRVSKQRQPLGHGDIITFGHLNGSRVKPGEHAPNRLAELSYIFEIDEKNSDSGSDTDQESDADSRPESAQSPKGQSSDEEDEDDDAESKKKKSSKTGSVQSSVLNGDDLFGGKTKAKTSKSQKDPKPSKSSSKKPMVFDQNDGDGSDSSEESDDEEDDDESDEDDSSDDESSGGEDNKTSTPNVVSETIYKTPISNTSPAKPGEKRRGRPSGSGGSKKGGATSSASPLSPPAKARKVGASDAASTPAPGKGRGSAAGTGGRPPGVLSEVKARKGSSVPSSTAKSTAKTTAKPSSSKGAKVSKVSSKQAQKAPDKKKPPPPPPAKKGSKKSKVDSKKVKSKATVDDSDVDSDDSASSGNDSASSGTKATQFMWHKEEYDVCASKKCLRPPGKRIQWVACDACDEWFHTECEGVNFEDVNKKDFEFFCGCSTGKPARRK